MYNYKCIHLDHDNDLYGHWQHDEGHSQRLDERDDGQHDVYLFVHEYICILIYMYNYKCIHLYHDNDLYGHWQHDEWHSQRLEERDDGQHDVRLEWSGGAQHQAGRERSDDGRGAADLHHDVDRDAVESEKNRIYEYRYMYI